MESTLIMRNQFILLANIKQKTIIIFSVLLLGNLKSSWIFLPINFRQEMGSSVCPNSQCEPHVTLQVPNEYYETHIPKFVQFSCVGSLALPPGQQQKETKLDYHTLVPRTWMRLIDQSPISVIRYHLYPEGFGNLNYSTVSAFGLRCEKNLHKSRTSSRRIVSDPRSESSTVGRYNTTTHCLHT